MMLALIRHYLFTPPPLNFLYPFWSCSLVLNMVSRSALTGVSLQCQRAKGFYLYLCVIISSRPDIQGFHQCNKDMRQTEEASLPICLADRRRLRSSWLTPWCLAVSWCSLQKWTIFCHVRPSLANSSWRFRRLV